MTEDIDEIKKILKKSESVISKKDKDESINIDMTIDGVKSDISTSSVIKSIPDKYKIKIDKVKKYLSGCIEDMLEGC